MSRPEVTILTMASYNFRGVAEPNGRNTAKAATNWPNDSTPPYPTYPASSCYGRMKLVNFSEPLLFYGANWKTSCRYSFEGPRNPLWVAMQGPSLRYDGGVTGPYSGWLTPSFYPTYSNARRWPAGRGWSDPKWSGNNPIVGTVQPTYFNAPDFLFQGLGYDLINPIRGGVGSAANDPKMWLNDDTGWSSTLHYDGAGMYGHPQSHSFQTHFIPAVALGKFWTEPASRLVYFGGSPGYTK